MDETIHVFGTPHTYDLAGPEQSPFTLVFVHGWLLSRAYWQPMIHRLSQSYRCLSYDLRGFGDSQPVNLSRELSTIKGRSPQRSRPLTLEQVPNKSCYTPSAYAQDLIALLTHLNIDQAWVIGHSLGGSIALWAAAQSNYRIRGIICVNSGGGIYLKEEFEKFRAVGQQLVALRPTWLHHIPFMSWAMSRLNVATPVDIQWGKQRLMDWSRADPEAALRSLMDSTTEEEVHQLPQLVARLKQPVYFIAGAQDTVMEPQYVNHLASFHTLFQSLGENVSELPGCGHLAMIEKTDQLTEKVKEILALHREVS